MYLNCNKQNSIFDIQNSQIKILLESYKCMWNDIEPDTPKMQKITKKRTKIDFLH